MLYQWMLGEYGHLQLSCQACQFVLRVLAPTNALLAFWPATKERHPCLVRSATHACSYTSPVCLSLPTSSLDTTVSFVAGLDMFRLGSVIGGTLVTGARSESLYQAIEELAGDTSSITLLDKAQAAVSTSKVALALNSVRKAMQARAPHTSCRGKHLVVQSG